MLDFDMDRSLRSPTPIYAVSCVLHRYIGNSGNFAAPPISKKVFDLPGVAEDLHGIARLHCLDSQQTTYRSMGQAPSKVESAGTV